MRPNASSRRASRRVSPQPMSTPKRWPPQPASNQRRTFARRRVALTRLHSATGGDEQPYPSDLDDLRRLPPADRAILFLTAVEGWAYAEVAPVVGCTEMAARARASRALRRLR